MNKILNLVLSLCLISALTSCKKIDIFGVELNNGRLSGYVKSMETGEPMKDIYVVVADSSQKIFLLTYTDSNGYFETIRMANGNYTCVPTCDSLYAPEYPRVEVKQNSKADAGTILIKETEIPTVSLPAVSFSDVTSNSVTMYANYTDGHTTIMSIGFKYLAEEVPEEGEEVEFKEVYKYGKTASISRTKDPWDKVSFSKNITGLVPDTEYRAVAYVSYRKGYTSTGALKTTYVYTEEFTFRTLPEEELPETE